MMRESFPLTEVFHKALMKEHANDWDMETVREAAYICSAEAVAASQADQVALLERLHNILLGNDYVPAFSEDDEAVYKAKFVRDAIETELAALRKGAK